MTTKRIETYLTIKAVDQYTGKLRGMAGVTGRFADKVRTEMGALQKLRGPLKLIEDFRKQQAVVARSSKALAEARRRVGDLKRTIETTANPTAKMRREFDSARRAAKRLGDAHERHRSKLGGLHGQLRTAGVNTKHLTAEQKRLATALNTSTTAFGRQMERMRDLAALQDRIAKGRDRMDRSLARAANLSFVGHASVATGRRLMTGISTPVTAAVEFETAMADVRKVADFETPAAFKMMSDDILTLSTHIPIAAAGLAEIVAAGAQANIPRKELLEYAEMAAKVGVAFDISAGMAGESMAQIKTALGLTLAETGPMFDAMNHLSNNMASSAPKILDFTKRVGAKGSEFGFDPTETMAFGSAMIAAGNAADVSATSFRNMGRALTMGFAATPAVRKGLANIGLEARDVAKRMQKDAVGTTFEVFEALSRLPDHMRAANTKLIFGDEARALAPLMNNLDLLRTALGLVAQEEQFLGSAEAEYAERARTTANALALTRNQATRLGVSVGEVVLPPLNKLLITTQGIVDGFVDWTKAHPKLTKWLLVGAASTAAMAVAGGALLTAAAGLIGTLAVLRFGLTGFGATAIFAAGGLGRVGGAFKALVGLRKLALSSLVIPLKWTAKLLPNFLPALALFKAFRKGSVAEISAVSRHVALETAAMSRSLSRLRLGALSAGVMTFMAMRAVPDDPEEARAFREKNVRAMDGFLRAVPGIGHLIEGYETVVTRVHGRPPPTALETLPDNDRVRHAASVVQSYAGITKLPTPENLKAMADFAEALRTQIAGVRAELDKVEGPTDAYDLGSPEYQRLSAEMQRAQASLQSVEKQMAADKAASEELTQALAVLNGTEVAVEINVEAINRALARVAKLAADLRALPGGKAAVATPPDGVVKRARGGPFGTNPLLVGEEGPEMYFPNRSGFIANNRQLMQMLSAANQVRAASLAAATASALVLPAAAQTSAPVGLNGVRVEIGSVNITAPSGVSDPEALVDLMERKLGDRISATLAASFSD